MSRKSTPSRCAAEQTGPYGLKGAGEIGIDGPAPAVANAVADACGHRLTCFPLTAERVLMALSAGGADETHLCREWPGGGVEVAADRRAVDVLREDLGLTGTKEGCGTGECGACSILVDGEARLSCLTLAGRLAGTRITTIEGMAPGPEILHPLQQSFVDNGAVQCGFCTPGMVITAGDFLARHPQAGRTGNGRGDQR
jgi:aerobic carbon-monoxide dehydrogenase small subunit